LTISYNCRIINTNDRRSTILAVYSLQITAKTAERLRALMGEVAKFAGTSTDG